MLKRMQRSIAENSPYAIAGKDGILPSVGPAGAARLFKGVVDEA